MSTKPLKKDLDIRTIGSLKLAHKEVHELLDSHRKKDVDQLHDGSEWDTGAGETYIHAITARFIRLNHNMLPDLLEAVSLLAELHEADNRVYETDAECDERAGDFESAMSKASVLLDKLQAKAAPKEGAVARGLRKAEVRYHGNNCPACNSGNIESMGNVQVDSSAWQGVMCKNCDFEWDDVYTLETIDIRDEIREGMLSRLSELGINVYKSENYGYGFTFCESDNYETEQDALLSAWKYAADNNIIATLSDTREVDVDDDMSGEWVKHD